MRVLFLVSDKIWSARARALALAARGLRARGHDVLLACDRECPVQVRAAESEVPIVSLQPDASAAGDAWQLRKVLQEKDVDVVFVHTEEELLVASSAVRLGLGAGAGAVIRRIPPFQVANNGRGARFASRIAPTGLLFTTEADRVAADAGRHRIPSVVAPLGVDPAEHEKASQVTKATLGAPADSRLIVCVHDGGDKRAVFTAMRTLALLVPRRPNLFLAIVGTTELDELRMHGAALGINGSIAFVGPRENEPSIIRLADVGWIAAEGDAAAFAALDFMACGTAVIADRTPLTEHYVADGIGGLLLAPAESTTTAGAVAAFLAKDEQRSAMGNAGRARLRREFPYESMIQGFEQAMGGVAGAAPRAPVGA